MTGREDIIEEGIVESVREGKAVIRVIGGNSCEECSAKILCRTDSDINSVTAADPFGVRKGDQVRISIRGKSLTSMSSLFYGIPLIILIAGILAGDFIFSSNEELYSALLALTFIVIYGVILYLYLKKSDHSSVIPKIIFVKRQDRD